MVGVTYFVYNEKCRLEAFAEWWRTNSAQDRDNFPPWMEPAEWEEQYLCWTETDEEINLFNSH